MRFKPAFGCSLPKLEEAPGAVPGCSVPVPVPVPGVPGDSPVRKEGAAGFDGTVDGFPVEGAEGEPKGLVVFPEDGEPKEELAPPPVPPEGDEPDEEDDPVPVPPVPPVVSWASTL